MDSQQYRTRAEYLLRLRNGGVGPSQRDIDEAAVWARLATAAAIEEQTQQGKTITEEMAR